MATWDDKHMYNWLGWMRSLINVRERINDWTVSPKKAYKFPIFIANNVILSPVLFFIVGIMSMLQTFEWIMANIIEGTDYLIVGNREIIVDNHEDEGVRQLRTLLGIVIAFALVLPYAITWGLPNIISENIKRHKEKRLNLQQDSIEAINEPLIQRRREEILQREIEHYLNALDSNKIRPKKYIKAHKFDTERKSIYVSPGVYIMDEFVITQQTNTARVARPPRGTNTRTGRIVPPPRRYNN